MFAHTPRSLVKPHLNLQQQFIVLSLYRPEATFFKSHPFFASSTHSLSARPVERLTAPILAPYCAGVSSNILNRFLSHRFSARCAHREPSWARSRSSSWGSYTKLLSFIFDFTQNSSALRILIFQRSDDTARFRDSAAQHRLEGGGCYIFQLRDRDSGLPLSTLLYLLYIPTQTRASLSVGLPVRLFVCLSV